MARIRINVVKYVHDTSYAGAVGKVVCQECNTGAFPGERTLHSRSCTQHPENRGDTPDAGVYHYLFGTAEVTQTMHNSAMSQRNVNGSLLNPAIIKAHCPDLLRMPA